MPYVCVVALYLRCVSAVLCVHRGIRLTAVVRFETFIASSVVNFLTVILLMLYLYMLLFPLMFNFVYFDMSCCQFVSVGPCGYYLLGVLPSGRFLESAELAFLYFHLSDRHNTMYNPGILFILFLLCSYNLLFVINLSNVTFLLFMDFFQFSLFIIFKGFWLLCRCI